VHDAPARLTPAPAALQGDHKSMEVILIRHTAVAVEPGTCYGHRDVPLAEPAEEAFERIAQRLPGVQAVASSPLQRCARLAGWLAAREGLPLLTDERWREMDFGAWEGQRWSALERHRIDQWALDPWGFEAPQGESVRAMHLRVRAALAALRVKADLAGWRRVAVVTHGGPIRVLLAELMGLAPMKVNALEIPFGGLFGLRRGPEGWQTVPVGDFRETSQPAA
jgi:alpha-ribazole phosphatase